MTLNAHAIALWAGIAGSAAAVYFPIHADLVQQRTDETSRAVDRQKRIDALNQRLVNDEGVIQVLIDQMSNEQRQTLNTIREVQRQAQEQPQVTMYDKAMPAAAPMADAPRTERPEVIADRLKTEIPDQPLDQPKEK